MTSIDASKVATHSFDWGIIKWLVSPDQNPGAKITFGEVVLLPGQGHARHNHPTSEEILYVLSGAGEQMVDDKPSFAVHPGDTISILTEGASAERRTSAVLLRGCSLAGG